MFGIGWPELLLLVLLFGVIPAVGIAAFGLLTALVWRAVVRRDRRRTLPVQVDDREQH